MNTNEHLFRGRILAPLFALGLLGLSACVRFPVQLQDATSHLEGPKSFESLGPAEGKACQFNLFYLIPFGGNQLWKAKERAIGEADGLTDVSVDSSIGLAIIGTVACTEVRGIRYRLVSQPETFQEPPVIPQAPPPEELVPDEEPEPAVDEPEPEDTGAPEDPAEVGEVEGGDGPASEASETGEAGESVGDDLGDAGNDEEPATQ